MKKVYILGADNCGYCTMAKSIVEKNYPNIPKDVYEYVNINEDNGDEINMLVGTLRSNGQLRGVPSTLLVTSVPEEPNKRMIESFIRGFDMNAINNLISRVLLESKNKQLEIPFKEEEEG